tara:strand:- start:4474 stop:4782 length:309 start_codon:yes stop_codon:yes gene_type:complete
MGGYISKDDLDMISKNNIIDVLGQYKVQNDDECETYEIIGDKMEQLEKKNNISQSVINELRKNVEDGKKKSHELLEKNKTLKEKYEKMFLKYNNLLRGRKHC